MVVVAIYPQVKELRPGEEGRCPVAQAFGGTGQGQADLPDALSHVIAHSGILGTRPGGTLSTHGLERDQTLVQPQV